VKARLEKIEINAKAKVAERGERRGGDYYKRWTHVPKEPIFIASTEDIGTLRVRANHIDAAIHYCIEQEKLKAAGAPI
jgi:hypothetical protein